MSHPWNKTIILNDAEVKQLLSEQFDLKVSSLQILGEGFDNTAYLVNDMYVFRFPHRELGIMCMQNELLLLPYLAQHLSFPFSYPKFIGRSTPFYPTAFAGYPILPGSILSDFQIPPVSSLKFAAQLAHWLKELHSVPLLATHKAALMGEQNWRVDTNNRKSALQKCIAKYAQYYLQAGFAPQMLLEIVSQFAFLNLPKTQDCYLHGDLYYKHILVLRSLTGLIDWGDVHIGSCGIDLSVSIMLFDEDTLKHFWVCYSATPEDIETAAFRAFCHAVMALPYFYETNSGNEMPWAKFALQKAIVALSCHL